MDKLQWFVAPIKTEWGEDMVCAGVEIDNDHMFDIYCERGQIEKVEQMLRQLKPEQEPVAWIEKDHLRHAVKAPFMCRVEPTQRLDSFIPLHTAPPSKPWVSLTDEEIEVNWQFLHGEEGSPPDHHDFARSIEAALKEKNT